MPFSVKQTNRTVLINRIDCFRPSLDPLPIGKARGHPFMIPNPIIGFRYSQQLYQGSL